VTLVCNDAPPSIEDDKRDVGASLIYSGSRPADERLSRSDMADSQRPATMQAGVCAACELRRSFGRAKLVRIDVTNGGIFPGNMDSPIFGAGIESSKPPLPALELLVSHRLCSLVKRRKTLGEQAAVASFVPREQVCETRSGGSRLVPV